MIFTMRRTLATSPVAFLRRSGSSWVGAPFSAPSGRSTAALRDPHVAAAVTSRTILVAGGNKLLQHGGSSPSSSTSSSDKTRILPLRRGFSSSTITGQTDESKRVVMEGDYRKVRCILEIRRRDNRPGALSKIANVFDRHNINMTHIESKLHYFAHDGMCFYIDFDGDAQEEKVQRCVEELRSLAKVGNDL